MKLIASLLLLFLLQPAAPSKQLIPFQDADKYGLMDMSGEIVIPARFDKTFPFKEGIGRFYHKGKFGYISADGNLMSPNIFMEAYDFNNGMARVKDGPVWSFINKFGKAEFSVRGEKLEDFKNGRAIFQRKGFFGFLNKKGEEICLPIFTEVNEFKNRLARVKVGQYYGLINRKGKFVMDLKYDYIGIPADSVLRVKSGGSWHVYNLKGRKLFSPKESITGEFSNGMAVIKVIDPSMVVWKKYMNHAGKIPIKTDFIWAGKFENERAVVKTSINDEKGYRIINKSGDIIGSSVYEKTKGHFSSGYLGAYKSGQWGYVNTNGEWQLPPIFFDIQPFEGNYAMASKGHRKWGIIDKSGKFVVPARYDVIVQGDYYFMAILGYYKSFYTNTGELVWEGKYDKNWDKPKN